jgi:PASTA domain
VGPVWKASTSLKAVNRRAGRTPQFTYVAPLDPRGPDRKEADCNVPKLTGKKLKAAKKGLTRAACKLGKVTQKKGATARTGKVVKQNPKMGKVLPAGSKVSVRLG